MIEIYTDGSVKKRNPKDSRGKGKYTWATFVDGVFMGRCILSEDNAAVNEMEMKAIKTAMETIQPDIRDVDVVIYTDSNNAVNWINGEFQCNAPNIKDILEGIINIQGRFFKRNMTVDVVKIARERNKAHVE